MFARATRRLVAALSLGLCSFVATLASAASPPMISAQGALRSSSGSPVSDGNYALTVALYEDAVTTTPLWSEKHAAVAVSQGAFAVVVGSVDPGAPLPVAKLLDAPAVWIGVAVDADPELPRTRLVSVPFALGATYAQNAMKAEAAAFAEEATKAQTASVADVATSAKALSGVLPGAQLSKDSVADDKLAFPYAGSTTKGGAASDLACTGCVSAAELAIDGDVAFNGYALTGAGKISAASVEVAGDVTTTGALSAGKDLTVGGAAKVGGTATFAKTVDIGGALTVTGAATFKGPVTFKDKVVFEGGFTLPSKQVVQICDSSDTSGPCFASVQGSKGFVDAAKTCAQQGMDLCSDSQAVAVRIALGDGLFTIKPNWTASFADNDSEVWTDANGYTGDDHSPTERYAAACCRSWTPPVQNEQTLSGFRVLKIHDSADTLFADASKACTDLGADLCDKGQYWVLRSDGHITAPVWSSDHSDNDDCSDNYDYQKGVQPFDASCAVNDDTQPYEQYGYACCATKRTSAACPAGATDHGGVCVAALENDDAYDWNTSANACAQLGARLCTISQTAVLRDAGVVTANSSWTNSRSDNDGGNASPGVGAANDNPANSESYGYACCF